MPVWKRILPAFLLIALAIISFSKAEAKTVKIFVTNDVHGYMENTPPDNARGQKGRIGYAHLKGYINAAEADVKILMDAGDAFSGNVYARMDCGQTIARLMGAMDYRYITPGNHAVDFNSVMGTDEYYSMLLDELRKSQWLNTERTRDDLCVAVAQNFWRAGKKPFRHNENKPVVIYDETGKDPDGMRIIVTGIITPATGLETNKSNLFGMTFGDKHSILSNLKKSVRDYNREKDIVIVLSHVGDQPEKGSLLGADIAMVPNVDIVVDSHSHTIRGPEKIGSSYYMIAGCYLEQFAEITITAGVSGVEMVGYEKATAAGPDPVIAEMVRKAVTGDVINHVLGPLPKGYELFWQDNDTRYRSTELGRFVCAVIAQAADADLAVYNGGGIRAPLMNDPVRVVDILNMLPLMNDVVTVKMTAQEIKDMFDFCFASEDVFIKADGGFPQFYGMTVELQPKFGGGYTVADISKNGVSILGEPWKTYTVAINSYMLGGGNNYKFNKENVIRSYADTSYIFMAEFSMREELELLDRKGIKAENLLIRASQAKNVNAA